MAVKFPAITVWQPHASLIAAGVKEYETRSWKPILAVGSIIMIHAGKTDSKGQRLQAQYLEQTFGEAVAKAKMLFDSLPHYPRGFILCACRYQGAFDTETLRPNMTSQELAFGDFKAGRWAWKLEVLKLAKPPISAPGKQGVWWWSDNIQ